MADLNEQSREERIDELIKRIVRNRDGEALSVLNSMGISVEFTDEGVRWRENKDDRAFDHQYAMYLDEFEDDKPREVDFAHCGHKTCKCTERCYGHNRDYGVKAEIIEDESTNNITVKVDVDVSEALTRLKALQREAREATKALRELEDAQKRTTVNAGPFVGHPNPLNIEMDGKALAKVVSEEIGRTSKLRGRL